MIVKARALRDEDKLARRGEILAAAERLFREHPEGLASMDELAEAAGVAKGTLYLYFSSKEEVMLALHEHHCESMFGELHRALADPGQFSIDRFLDLVQKHALGQPEFMSVGALVVGMMERSLPLEAAQRFRTRLGEWLLEAGAGIERTLGIPTEEAARLMTQSFALMLGMWQLKGCCPLAHHSHELDPKREATFARDFPRQARQALDDLWAGALLQRSKAAPERLPARRIRRKT